MKKLMMILVAVGTAFSLTACGGGGDAPATFTQVPVSQATPAVVVAAPPVLPNQAVYQGPAKVPETAPQEPAKHTDVTLTGVPVNVKQSTVSVGQHSVNLAAFTATFDKDAGDASVQELVFRNTKGGNTGDIFSMLRFADARGDVCPQYFCYVQWAWNTNEVRVVFTYGWRPTGGELATYALQGDVSTTAPSGTTFAFELVGVQMRQWGKTVDGAVVGKALEVQTIVALPTIISPMSFQITGAQVGQEYSLVNVTANCPIEAKSGCLMKGFQLYVENGKNLTYTGPGYPTITPQAWPGSYTVEFYHFLTPGTTGTWLFAVTAADSFVYASVYQPTFVVDGVEVSPIVQDYGTSCWDITTQQKVCVGGKG